MLFGRPALMTAWRAGFWPTAAVSTWPRMASLMVVGSMPVCAIRPLMTWAPSSDAGTLARLPPNLPTAVRAAATITTSSICFSRMPAGPAGLSHDFAHHFAHHFVLRCASLLITNNYNPRAGTPCGPGWRGAAINHTPERRVVCSFPPLRERPLRRRQQFAGRHGAGRQRAAESLDVAFGHQHAAVIGGQRQHIEVGQLGFEIGVAG